MALVFPGRTRCQPCGEVIASSADSLGFPAFLPEGHDLHRFSDSALHTECFQRAPEAARVEELYARYRRVWESRPQDLRTAEEIEAWGEEAFRDFP